MFNNVVKCRTSPDLEEYSGVFLVELHQLQVGDGINAAHSKACNSHRRYQHQQIAAYRDEGEHHRDDERGCSEGRQRGAKSGEERRDGQRSDYGVIFSYRK